MVEAQPLKTVLANIVSNTLCIAFPWFSRYLRLLFGNGSGLLADSLLFRGLAEQEGQHENSQNQAKNDQKLGHAIALAAV